MKAKYLLLSLTILLQVSCNNWLDLVPPDGLIRDEYWKTKEDVESLLMSAYEIFAAMDRTLFIHGEIRADMVKGDYNQPRDEQLISESNIYPDNDLCNWQDFYTVINSCNEVIKNAPEVLNYDKTFTEFQLQSLISEAYFLRSLSYFYLVRIYHEVPLILEPSETDNVDFFVAKSTEEQVLNQITSDLEKYLAFAPNGSFPFIEENKGRASKNAFAALLADIALWRFDYEKVIKHVESIEMTQEFFLIPGSLWFENFFPGNSLESIFELQYDGERNQRNKTYSLTRYESYQYDPSQKALELFSFDFARELIRGENASIRRYGDNDFVIWKYIGRSADGRTFRSGNQTYSCNWIIYRFSDILLMKAEALSQLERYSEALGIINEIRTRADVLPLNLANNPVIFEDAILEERALELAFEGKRWFDLLRMGRRNNYARKDNLIDIIVKNVPSSQKRILAAKLTNPMGWYLPIYETEIERNLNLVQNPYYNY
ncbi:MAG TPA: RagB/SusD family nutrient uptake outer membrane protein [Mariniphaga anaerophila]|uniref:RagB/SusD family nutrient uptake outer membrane protein n=1 Tax=Mariniphaga anaerophila TaxID=1484053 RepID=A0A831LM60_9BACT|nr:RagB/SusD family nutrient uptake outer membrane protein [Mariniphaga anaerophila]